jgi:hypothetical protein
VSRQSARVRSRTGSIRASLAASQRWRSRGGCCPELVRVLSGILDKVDRVLTSASGLRTVEHARAADRVDSDRQPGAAGGCGLSVSTESRNAGLPHLAAGVCRSIVECADRGDQRTEAIDPGRRQRPSARPRQEGKPCR